MYIGIDENNKIVHIDNSVAGKNYYCPVCREKLSARRGEIKHHYFAHMPGSKCSDTWEGQYDMSEWHRNWQNLFPSENQEVVVELGSIKHRADIMVGKTVIEFQHSRISRELFNKRNSFYHDLGYKVIWLFDISDEVIQGKIHIDENRMEWNNPLRVFNKFKADNDYIEIYFQLGNEGDCIVKLKETLAIDFRIVQIDKKISCEEFLEYFQTGNSYYQLPEREDLVKNIEYKEFKHKFDIVLDEQQERAVQAVDGANLVLAVPGSGKTTVLVSRIGYMVNVKNIDQSIILALSYTKKSAEDMKNRYESKFGECNVEFRTINSIAYEIVRNFVGKKELISDKLKKTILREIYKSCCEGSYPSESDLLQAETTITCIKNMMLESEEIDDICIWNIKASDIYKKYEEALERSGKIDYDDQLVLAYKELARNNETKRTYNEKYKYICVDEAQDTSKIQYEIIKLLVGENNNIFMVGDEDQSIYGFRAAYPKALMNFKEEYKNPFVLQLETNYRSAPEIVDKAAEFIAKNKNRYKKKMCSYRDDEGRIDEIVVCDRSEQYKRILELVRQTEDEIAFIYRNNECAVPIIDMFLRENIIFSAKALKNIRFFTEHVVMDIKSFLKLAIDYKDTNSFEHIYYKCNAYISKKDVRGICGKVKDDSKNIFEAMLEFLTYGYRNDRNKAIAFKKKIQPMTHMKPYNAIKYICDNGYGDYLKEKGIAAGSLDILLSLAVNDETIKAFLEHLDCLEKNIKSLEEKKSNINLLTVHSSKGLEFDNVYLVDVYDGMTPCYDVSTEEDSSVIEEERRIFYVGMTRAKNRLGIFHIQNKRSMYIDEIFRYKSNNFNMDQNLFDLHTLISLREENEIIVTEVLSNKFYSIYMVDDVRFNAREFIPDTGEIIDENSNQKVNEMAKCNIWKEYEI